MVIRVRIDAPSGAPAVVGFKYWWARYVRGFDQTTHCGFCLKGWHSKRVKRGMATGVTIDLDEVASENFDFVYMCGVRDKAFAQVDRVANGYDDNFHLVLKPSARGRASKTTYNGLVVKAAGAVAVPITPLKAGWNGLELKYTSCRNFQFGVEQYGYDPNIERPEPSRTAWRPRRRTQPST